MHMDTAKYPHEQIIPTLFPKGNYWFNTIGLLWLISIMIIITIMPASLSLIGDSYAERNGVTLDYSSGLIATSITLLNIDGYLILLSVIYVATSCIIDLQYLDGFAEDS